MSGLEIPDEWFDEAVAAKRGKHMMDGTWCHYDAVVDIARKAAAKHLRRLAAELAINPEVDAARRLLTEADALDVEQETGEVTR